MDDATLGRVMTYVGLGLGIAPVLLILLLGHRVLIDALLGLCRWKGLLARMLRGGLSLFTGLMLASAVGVLVPQLWLPSAHLLCDGQVEVTSQNYSYKPGQHGTNMAVICTAATGTQTKITLASIFLSALLYGGALFVLMELVGLMLRTFQRDT
ncbi:MAG TPA: hypothetical protein VIR56_11010, partial [Solimonas sp.]